MYFVDPFSSLLKFVLRVKDFLGLFFESLWPIFFGEVIKTRKGAGDGE